VEPEPEPEEPEEPEPEEPEEPEPEEPEEPEPEPEEPEEPKPKKKARKPRARAQVWADDRKLEIAVPRAPEPPLTYLQVLQKGLAAAKATQKAESIQKYDSYFLHL
jgi:hypothetical protein